MILKFCWLFCWLMLLSPLTFTWHKVNLPPSSLVILFCYHLKSVIAKPQEREHVPFNICSRKGTDAFVYQLFHDTKSIFYHLVQFFYFFYHLMSVIINLEWMRGINLQIIWLNSSNNLEILLVILLVNAFVPPPLQLLHDTKPIFCHQVQLFIFLPPEAKPREGDTSPQHLHQGGGAPMLLSPNFFMLQSQYSIIKFSCFIFSSTWSQC